jgi:hypothetical protein
MASVTINSTVAFERGDTFIFGSWVCVADGAGSFLRFIAATPEQLHAPPSPQATVTNLVENLGEIMPSDPTRGHVSEFEYNSTLTPAKTGPHESVSNPSSSSVYLPPAAIFRLRPMGAAYQAALTAIN